MSETKDSRTARARLDDWMANPGCEKNEASAILNYSLSNLDGADESTTGPSTLATFLGNSFEQEVVYKVGPLLSEKGQHGINNELPWSTGIPKDARLGKIEADAQIEESLDRLRDILVTSSDTGRNHILNGFRIPFDPFPPAKTVEIDLVALSPVSGQNNHFNFVIGEVKVYPDQGGYTDEHKISAARRQAGLYCGILRAWLADLPKVEADFAPFTFTVASTGFIVLTQPGSILEIANAEDWVSHHISVVVNENLDTQREIIDHNYEVLLERFESYGSIAASKPAEKKLAIEQLPHEFNEGCWGRCALAKKCHQAAIDVSDPIILGSRVKNAMRGLDLVEVQNLARSSLDGPVDVDAEMSDAATAVAKDFDDFRFRELEEI